MELRHSDTVWEKADEGTCRSLQRAWANWRPQDEEVFRWFLHQVPSCISSFAEIRAKTLAGYKQWCFLLLLWTYGINKLEINHFRQQTVVLVY